MRPWVVILIATALLVAGGGSFGLYQFSKLWPKASTEITELTPSKRALLLKLRAEHKFQPHDYPPLGYTGAETPEDAATGSRAVDGVIDAVLARPDGPLPAKVVSHLIGRGLRPVKPLATEDRDRAQGYMLEIWYLLGYRGATGRFAYGSYDKPPPGYGEPLPPGWSSPTQPRPSLR